MDLSFRLHGQEVITTDSQSLGDTSGQFKSIENKRRITKLKPFRLLLIGGALIYLLSTLSVTALLIIAGVVAVLIGLATAVASMHKIIASFCDGISSVIIAAES